jgi:hypothetical protein
MDSDYVSKLEEFIRPYISQYFYKDFAELQRIRCFIKQYKEDNENSL